jgi:hypothetical protein
MVYISGMPLIPLSTLPENARVWVFGSDRTLDATTSAHLLQTVDAFLDTWKAHGVPLTVGRDWREGRFLTIAVDVTHEYASGCSIDGLFRALRGLEPTLGASLVGGGQVFYRDAAGAIQRVDRGTWTALGDRGEVSATTPVFDLAVQTLGEWRTRFELPAGRSWPGALLPSSASPSSLS